MTSVRVYGDNSMPQAALDALQVQNAWPQPRSKWGFVTRPVTEMGAIAEGHVLYISPLGVDDAIFQTPLWQAMPLTREDRLASIDAVWTYGGVFSIGYLAELISKKMIEVAPE